MTEITINMYVHALHGTERSSAPHSLTGNRQRRIAKMLPSVCPSQWLVAQRCMQCEGWSLSQNSQREIFSLFFFLFVVFSKWQLNGSVNRIEEI